MQLDFYTVLKQLLVRERASKYLIFYHANCIKYY